MPWKNCLVCGHSPPAMMYTSALRCDCVHAKVPASFLLRGPLRSPCNASQNTTRPGSPSFPSVALISDQCNVALAAYLATAAGAMYLRLSLKPVCVVSWMAVCGVQPSLARTMNSAPAGPETFCQGLSATDSLASAPRMELCRVQSSGDRVRTAMAHSKSTS